MKKVFLLTLILALTSLPAIGREKEETIRFGRFGNVVVYRNSPLPAHVVLFVSGDGGWNLGVVDMAKALAANDALVAGIDITHYLKQLQKSKEACVYPAADFEMLGKFIQKKMGFPSYRTPVLVGYSSGATLVYAILGQAPPGTFRGAMSLGFCPDLDVNKPFCKGSGLEWQTAPDNKGIVFNPLRHLRDPWIAFQGTIDQVCDPAATERFAGQVHNGRMIRLPKVGHGFSVQKNWMPQFKAAFAGLVAGAAKALRESDPGVSDLPVVEMPAATKGPDMFAVILSGDGGWVSIDREIGALLAGEGIPVAGLNSLSYFWSPRTPEGAAEDLTRIIRHYRSVWQKDKLLLIGYSFGADVLPFLINRLPETDRRSLAGAALISPGRTADFEFHISDWIGGTDRDSARRVMPEIEKLRGYPLLCFAGESESDSLCRDIRPPLAKIVILPGGHHLGGDYSTIVRTILNDKVIGGHYAEGRNSSSDQRTDQP